MTRAHPLRWFLGAFAAGALLAVSLVTYARACRAAVDPLAQTAAECDAVVAKWRASR